MSKYMDFYQLQEIFLTNAEKKLLNTTTKTGLNAQKTASKKYSIKQLTQHENSQEKKRVLKL